MAMLKTVLTMKETDYSEEDRIRYFFHYLKIEIYVQISSPNREGRKTYFLIGISGKKSLKTKWQGIVNRLKHFDVSLV